MAYNRHMTKREPTVHIKQINPLKRRNPAAAALALPQYRQRTVRDRTKYSRKGRKKDPSNDQGV